MFFVVIGYLGFETLFRYYDKAQFWFFRTTDVFWLFDLYIRAHCQYYNKNGILVTHPWSTMKHYLSTSFVIDFITYLPSNYMKLYRILGNQHSEFLRLMFRVILKPLQLHRFFSLVTYYQTNITNQQSALIQKVKYTVMVLVAIMISSVILINPVCDITVKEGVSVTFNFNFKIRLQVSFLQVSCTENTWITNNVVFENSKQPRTVFLLSIFLPFNYFALTGGLFILVGIDEIITTLPVVFTLYILRWFFLAQLTSYNVS